VRGGDLAQGGIGENTANRHSAISGHRQACLPRRLDQDGLVQKGMIFELVRDGARNREPDRLRHQGAVEVADTDVRTFPDSITSLRFPI
jgi:hypothetical protein